MIVVLANLVSGESLLCPHREEGKNLASSSFYKGLIPYNLLHSLDLILPRSPPTTTVTPGRGAHVRISAYEFSVGKGVVTNIQSRTGRFIQFFTNRTVVNVRIATDTDKQD